jgi:1-acyl-sn-glycerol-3-phosphate acyltransferase
MGAEPRHSSSPWRERLSTSRRSPRSAVTWQASPPRASAPLFGSSSWTARHCDKAFAAASTSSITRESWRQPADAGSRASTAIGFDPEWTESLLPLFRWVYRNWWRVQVHGIENVPAQGRALLVANHAGVVPYNGAMIRVAIFEEQPARPHARALVLDQLMGMPIGSWFVRRTGNTLADSGDAERLLRDDQLVLVFPEGAKGTGKLNRERYRLRRFGRGTFAKTAIRTGAPILPISVVGSKEVHPMVADAQPVARLLGLPNFPITPTFPWLGPLGVIPLPTSWTITFHEVIQVEEFRGGEADPAAVLGLADQVRDVIQQGLYAGLERRGSVFSTSA